MKWHLPNLREIIDPVKNNFFLRKYIPLESTLQILKDLYPNINWSRVDFYEGLPWFTPSVAPYVGAQALPNFYSTGRFRIYLKKFDESRAQCLSDIVHEAFHIMQAMNYFNGYGLGFFRGFMFYYIAEFIKHGYRQNPFEIPAYDQEFRFLQYCEKHKQHGISPPVDPEAFINIKKESSLVFTQFNYKYQGSVLNLFLSFIFCTVITIVKAPVDLLIFLVRLLLPKPKTVTAKGQTL